MDSNPTVSTVTNHVRMEFPSLGENVAFARTAVAVFASQLDYTLEELDEIKVAVSEAVSNCVIHAYPETVGTVVLEAAIRGDALEIVVRDRGRGIEDVNKALEPTYTTLPEERMGLGLAFIKMYMDEIVLESTVGEGTTLHMTKTKASKRD
ncbi:MAG TPA: anti-sigma F factor [Firmicutes bacterium]|nr:anti-sigma F factor [Bacillota bacterium]